MKLTLRTTTDFSSTLTSTAIICRAARLCDTGWFFYDGCTTQILAYLAHLDLQSLSGHGALRARPAPI